MKLHTLLTCTLLGACFAPSAHALTLRSNVVTEGKPLNIKQVFNGFGCEGENLSPDLTWADAPKGTESYAITVYDPDAPTGSGWWHWVVFNIPKTATSLTEAASLKAMPQGAVESLTDYGTVGFGGACPPVGHGVHHYQITVYALKTAKLDLDAQKPAAMVGYYLHQNMIEKATITATYERK